ncbi:MAG: histidine kinase [Proteobacteria bacterium]|nr:histidine kinase [Pseudomonadota bacterium]
MTTSAIQTEERDVWTRFDPSKRASQEEVEVSVHMLTAHPLVVAILDSASVSMVVVNQELQIVAANQAMLDSLGQEDVEVFHGKRLGEAVRCVNAKSSEGGCASSDKCHSCGTSQYILRSQQTGHPSEGECLLVMNGKNVQNTSEYNVRATPVTINGRPFTVVALQDISDSKRRRVLERVFIHDLQNTLTGLIGWSEQLVEQLGEVEAENASAVERLSRRLASEVNYYRALLEVEANDFEPRLQSVLPVETIENVQTVFSHHHAVQEKSLAAIEPIAKVFLLADPFILERVLINMVKNALEATPAHGTVRIGCTADDRTCRFSVWNKTLIPDEISPRIFQRSFSTKSDTGRGIGTYSMKLFGERVLGGRVWFTSTEKEGTTFYIELPCSRI